MKYVNYSIVIADSSLGDSVFLQTLPEFNMSKGHQLDEVHLGYIVSFTIAFFLVGIIGVVGNVLVIFVIFHDKKMRKSLTNMLIVNLAVADSIILIFGIPEIVQFMLNRGWILGEAMCRIQRTVLVISLYVSVLTLVALCIER